MVHDENDFDTQEFPDDLLAGQQESQFLDQNLDEARALLFSDTLSPLGAFFRQHCSAMIAVIADRGGDTDDETLGRYVAGRYFPEEASCLEPGEQD